MKYEAQLKTQNWIDLRKKIISRAEESCENCGSDCKPFHIHHKIYYKNFYAWEYSEEDLICLCESCHWSEHHCSGCRKKIKLSEKYDNPNIVRKNTKFYHFSCLEPYREPNQKTLKQIIEKMEILNETN